MYSCEYCDKTFTLKRNATRHMTTNCIKNPNINKNEAHITCQYCGKIFTRLGNLNKHIEFHCEKPAAEEETTVSAHGISPDNMQQKFTEFSDSLKKEMETFLDGMNQKFDMFLKEISPDNYVIEQVKMEFENNKNELHKQLSSRNAAVSTKSIGLSPDDKILDLLIPKMNGDRDKAISYIRSCALSGVVGDVNLINAVYFDNPATEPHYINGRKDKIEYFDENGLIDIAGKEKIGNIFANVLKSAYLAGYCNALGPIMGKKITAAATPDQVDNPTVFVKWNEHIAQFQNDMYRKKLMNNLGIKIKTTK